MENRLCECGKDTAIFSLRGKGKRGARWCAACPDLPPAAINILEASRSHLYYASHKLCKCQRSTPTYALPGQMAKWCARCPELPQEAISLTTKMCPCGRGRPKLNLRGTSDPIWCPRCVQISAFVVLACFPRSRILPSVHLSIHGPVCHPIHSSPTGSALQTSRSCTSSSCPRSNSPTCLFFLSA